MVVKGGDLAHIHQKPDFFRLVRLYGDRSQIQESVKPFAVQDSRQGAQMSVFAHKWRQ